MLAAVLALVYPTESARFAAFHWAGEHALDSSKEI